MYRVASDLSIFTLFGLLCFYVCMINFKLYFRFLLPVPTNLHFELYTIISCQWV